MQINGSAHLTPHLLLHFRWLAGGGLEFWESEPMVAGQRIGEGIQQSWWIPAIGTKSITLLSSLKLCLKHG